MSPSYFTSLKMSKKLMEAGIDFSESDKVWSKPMPTGEPRDLIFNHNWNLELRRLPNDKYAYQYKFIPAPSLMEILDRLPDNKRTYMPEVTAAPTATDACAAMLLKIKEGK